MDAKFVEIVRTGLVESKVMPEDFDPEYQRFENFFIGLFGFLRMIFEV